MIDKKIYLALFIDKYNVNNHYYILNRFNNSNDLDNFTVRFKNYEELRKYYEVDISEYLMDNQKIVSENETKNKKFRGRISAFYYNDRGGMEFLEIKYHKRKIVRDYLELNNVNDAMAFIKKVYDKAFEKVLPLPCTKSDKLYCIMEILNKYNYHISEEEIKYIYNYIEIPTEKRYKDIIILMKTNIKRRFKDIEEKEMDRVYADYNRAKYLNVEDSAPEFLKYNLNDDESLFLNHDIDEIDKYTDRFRRK